MPIYTARAFLQELLTKEQPRMQHLEPKFIFTPTEKFHKQHCNREARGEKDN